jgi:hypothetical protein
VEVPRARRNTPPPLAYQLERDRLDGVPSSRPSERPTLKTLPPVEEPSSGNSNTEVIELSASALDSVPDVSRREVALPVVRFRGRASGIAMMLATLPKRLLGRIIPRTKIGRAGLVAAGVLAAVWLTTGGAGAVSAHVTGMSEGLAPSREPNAAASQHTPLVLRAPPQEGKPAAGQCATAGASRVLATRAHLAPGLDVNVLDGGFGVGFAASGDEALGLRLGGSPLRVADRVRVRSGAGVKHVAVDAARNDDDGIDVRIDADGARTVVPDGEAPAFRIAIASGWIQVMSGSPVRGKVLWPVPGGVKANPKAKGDAIVDALAGVKAKAASGGTKTSDGFVRLGAGSTPPRSTFVNASVPDLRAAAREDGGAVIALRRPSALWLGLVDARLGAHGPLVALTRPGAVLGMPSVAPLGGGGAVAWAERPAGERELIVMVASFGDGEDGSPRTPKVMPISAGMSPSIAMLPDGDLLLAYAVGTAGSHRVVVRRLGRDLEPRGEPVLVSPDEINAGQPAAAVAADGRGLVAFFGAERGRPSSVLATPLACATGL